MTGLATRSLIAFAFTLTAFNCVVAQRAPRPGPSIPAVVHGQVRYAKGGAPAENVLVRIESFRGGLVGQMMTDNSGKFRFSGLAPEQYVITVHAPGFKDAQRQVDLQTSPSDYVLFQLTPDGAASSAPAAAAELIDARVPAEARNEFEKGRAAVLDARQVDKGLPHLAKAVEICPNFFEAQLLLGTVYMDLRQWKRSEDALRRAQEINPRASEVFFALGEVYRRQGKLAEAEKELQEGLKLNNRSPQGHFTLGRVYWQRAEITKAGPEVGRALQLKPDFAEAHLLAGNILLRARQPENALVEFEEYLRLAPNGEFAAQTRDIIQKIRQALVNKK
jgi:Tfp pilus assembly protein PilF